MVNTSTIHFNHKVAPYCVVWTDLTFLKLLAQQTTRVADVISEESLSRYDRIYDYIHTVDDPYSFRAYDMNVKMSFAGNKTLDDCITDYLKIH